MRVRRITRAQSVKPVFSHPRSKLHTAPRSILETPSPRGDPARTGHIYLRRAPTWKNARSLARSIESLSCAGMVNTVKAHPAQPATRRSDLHCTCCIGTHASNERTHVVLPCTLPFALDLGRSSKFATQSNAYSSSWQVKSSTDPPQSGNMRHALSSSLVTRDTLRRCRDR